MLRFLGVSLSGKPGIVFCLVFMSFVFSCKTPQQTLYFQDIKGDTTIRNTINSDFDLKIKKNDVLSVSITSISPEASAVFNSSLGINNTATASVGSASLPGYIVDNNGNIEIVKIGKVHAEGLTKKELKNNLETQLLPYLKEPLVTVKFLNQKVTVIGEIGHVSVIPITQEKISIIDAIAYSGDIPKTGKQDNILLIRTTDSSRIFKRLNLSNTTIFTSPYFYLQPDDIVYIQPKKVNPTLSPELVQVITLALSTISLVIVIIKGFK